MQGKRGEAKWMSYLSSSWFIVVAAVQVHVWIVPRSWVGIRQHPLLFPWLSASFSFWNLDPAHSLLSHLILRACCLGKATPRSDLQATFQKWHAKLPFRNAWHSPICPHEAHNSFHPTPINSLFTSSLNLKKHTLESGNLIMLVLLILLRQANYDYKYMIGGNTGGELNLHIKSGLSVSASQKYLNIRQEWLNKNLMEYIIKGHVSCSKDSHLKAPERLMLYLA